MKPSPVGIESSTWNTRSFCQQFISNDGAFYKICYSLRLIRLAALCARLNREKISTAQEHTHISCWIVHCTEHCCNFYLFSLFRRRYSLYRGSFCMAICWVCELWICRDTKSLQEWNIFNIALNVNVNIAIYFFSIPLIARILFWFRIP